MKHLPLDVK